MTTLYIDLETYCEVPIKYGTHAYAEKAEVLLFAYALGNGPVNVWEVADGATPTNLLAALYDPEVLVCAHNSHFDRTVLRHAMLPLCPSIDRWRDTMAKALAHSLPAGLDALCAVLGIESAKAKDKEGKQLIQLFCKPQPASRKIRRATKHTHPEEWARFVTYAGQDIVAMREVDKKLPNWNYQGNELALWHLDQHINDRGITVDTALAHAAIDAVEVAQVSLKEQAQTLTEGSVQSATQRDEMLKHILNAYGVTLPDLQKSTLERRINDPELPQALRDLLAVRLQASTSSTSKYKTLIRGVSSDGRLRGTLQFCGASRTGRWAGRLFQPHNLPRPTLNKKEIPIGIEALKLGCADLLFDNVMELTSSVIRGCIVAPKGKKLVVSDLSNIEGRVLAWEAGEAWKLRAFSNYDNGTGHDLYNLAYAKAFGVTPESVVADTEAGGIWRQIGKVMELALGYEGGVGAFVTFAAAYNLDLEDLARTAKIPAQILAESKSALEWFKENKRPLFGLSDAAWVTCDALKRMWRNTHPAISQFWKSVQACAIDAVNEPGNTFKLGAFKFRRDGNWLRIRLPSGRCLCYPSPKIIDGVLTYMGVNQYTRKWDRISTYGGKLVENITQAVARDVLAANMPAIEEHGYEIVLTVHDEEITEAPDSDEYSHKHLAALMSQVPDWAKGLPLASAGFESYRYRKG